MATSPREFFTRFLDAMSERNFDVLQEMVHPDFVAESPQSRERAHGFSGFRAQFESYPGGAPLPSLPDAQLLGDNERWAITPAYTVVPLSAPNKFTVLLRVQYPDGSWWRSVSLIELRDDRLFRLEAYFAPELDPPLLRTMRTVARG